MKQLNREASLLPKKLQDNEAKAKLYMNLRSPQTNKIKPRWNTISENKVYIVRHNLLKLSHDECAYCGKKIVASDLDVDHILPSSKFPYLAYCWENYLPSCKRCNQALKRDYTPPALDGKVIIESCMMQQLDHYDFVYAQPAIYDAANDERLIDPTFDVVDEHIVFNPEYHYYKARTKIGEKTIEVFFQNVEIQEFLEGISNIVKAFVKKGSSWQDVQTVIDTYGSSFYYKAYWDYWMNEKANNRLI